MDQEEKIVVLDHWPSTFGVRVHMALAEKGLTEYETKDEDLFEKSSLLLEMNPVHKKVPVFVHNGVPICESLVILQYIDEVWSHAPSLLPSDPYERSRARFWADFVDKKIHTSAAKIWMCKGEELEQGKKEHVENWKILERELGEKEYFGGERLGFVDIALLPYTSWFYLQLIMGNIDMNSECPKIAAWVQRCKLKDSVARNLSDPVKVYDYMLLIKKRYGLD
ncbi:PREDICTED: probable glutathione S-transferase [Tarenaya hassleriana]|uniref:probable glutathione S-transferase n=1 Tax=Tarenaya hassleriana TaxID=28532 RepID=UPI00053C1AD0|nr:PREDICTED: probable glutathione S-transferase [Tarenaya hassleriana]